jgi:hypothetical protein
MPKYVKSRARKEFDGEIDKLIRIIRTAFSAKCNLKDVREHVLASVMVQGSAKMEVYLTSLVSDWVNRANAAGLLVDQLPPQLRAYQLNELAVQGAYSHYIAFGNEPELLDKLAGRLNHASHRFALNGQACPALDSERLCKDRRYPSQRNLKVLFHRFGIVKLFDQLAKSAKAGVSLLLDSFNDVRTELAHEGIPPGLTAGDIRKRLRDAAKFIGHIDRVFFANVGSVGAVSLWTT